MKTQFLLKQTILFILVLLASKLLLAQSRPAKQWDVRFGGISVDVMYSLQKTSDGGYILGGTSSSPTGGDKTQPSQGQDDYWIVKIDASGNKQWDKRFGGSNFDEFTSLQQTTDGGYILGGSSASGISGDRTQASRGQDDYWIVKTDANGNKIWDVRFGTVGNDELTVVQQTPDGGYILGGYAGSGISGDKTQSGPGGPADYWIIKTDANGVKQWDKVFGGTNEDDLRSLQQTSDGGYILGGASLSNNNGDRTEPTQGDWDYWIVKTDANGVKQWDKRFGGSGADFFNSIQQTTDGGYILGGRSSSGISGDKSQGNQGSQLSYDYWIVKINTAGVKQWDARFGGSADEVFSSLQQTAGGGYILAGYSASGISGDRTQDSWGNYDYWIVKTDGNGNKQWDERFGGIGNEQLYSIQQTTDYGYILGGSSGSPLAAGDKSQPNRGADDYWIVKTAPDCIPQTFYADADHDGYGNPSVTTQTCFAPPNYVADNTDCNDNDATVHAPVTYYKDNDGDGFGDANNTTSVCSSTPPQSYAANVNDCDDTKLLYADADNDGYGAGSPVACGVSNNTDCNDNDATVHAPVTYYKDNDGDGFGDANNATSACLSTPPQSYVANANDCDDTKLLYADADNDGYGAGSPVACGVSNNIDCNDNDATVHAPVPYYKDNDGDGFGDANNTTSVCSSTPPQSYVANANDCDDTKLLYADADNDGYGAGSPVACGVSNNTDCNDNDAMVHAPITYFKDNDGDGFGDANNTTSVCSSTPPQSYVANANDCDDTKLLYADADNDGYGAGSPVACGVANNTDCNDNDATVHVPVTYFKDNDGDGFGDANNTTSVCSSTPPQSYVDNANDCDDTKLLYADADNDGYGAGSPVACGVANNTDCNDNDATVHAPVTYYKDNDGDGFGNPSNTIQTCSSTPPQSYVANANDCDDTKLLYADADNDGYGAGSPVACGVANNTDCNDNDATVHAPVTYYKDNDGDGFGNPSNTIQTCSSTPPQSYVANANDCDDTKLLYADADNDGYGAGSPVACGVANNTDCNENNPNVHPGAIEICGNQIDDNCNGQTDENCNIPCTLSINAGPDESTFYGYSGDQTVTHTAIVSGGTAPFTYSWTMDRPLLCNVINASGDESFIAGTCSNTQCLVNGSPTSNPLCTGSSSVTVKLLDTAHVCVTVTDAKGCTATDCFVVNAEDARCFAGNNTKVKVCHRTGSQTNPWVQICVADDAVPTHIAMGDYVGTCALAAIAAEIPSDAPLLKVQAFPNPFETDFNLSIQSSSNEDVEIVITDMYGRKVYQSKGSSKKQYRLGSNLASGVYVVRVIQGKEVQTLKVVK